MPRLYIAFFATFIAISQIPGILYGPGSAFAHLLQQTEETASPTVSAGTPTTTSSLTMTPSPSGTFEISPTFTLSPTSSGISPTETPTSSATQTPTMFPSPTESFTTTPEQATLIPPMAGFTHTPTLIPFPSVTFFYPTPNPLRTLLASFRQPDLPAIQKEEAIPWQSRFWRFWPLCLLGSLWLILGVWFVISQRQTD